MTSKIRVLAETLINQIAAGEVIENPASVVKELVENSLDAGSKKVVVDVQGGGLHSLRISDDGSGMGKDDALLCLERHATSKIKEAKDLFQIQTMGFRGEALASVASISRMTLVTSLSEIGVKVEVDGGRISSVDPHPRNQGTTIEVRNLFYNVPARKKFQKSPSACFVDISKVMTTLSLGYPEVGFELQNAGQAQLNVEAMSGGDFLQALKKRVGDTLGSQFTSSVIEVCEVEGPFMLKGFIGRPENTRHNRLGQYLFINRRAVVSPAISYAVRDAFATRISQDRHPVYVLHLEMPSNLIDVNVHPQKKEVRLSDESWVKSALQKAISRCLEHPAVAFTHERAVFDDFPLDVTESLIEEKAQEIKLEPSVYKPSPFKEIDFSSFTKKIQTRPVVEPKEESKDLFSRDDLMLQSLSIIGIWSGYLFVDAKAMESFKELNIKERTGFCLVDIKSAKSKVIYHKILSSKQDPCHKQGLLFPLSFEMPPYEIEQILSCSELLSDMGFSLSQSGPRSILVDAIPSFLKEDCVEKILHEIAFDTLSLDTDDIESLEIKKMRKIAQVVVRNMRWDSTSLQMNEAKVILEELLKMPSPCYCPLGNKTIVYISGKDVSAFFSHKER